MFTQNCRILAVDDMADNLFLLKTVLEAEGFVVDLADSGSQALEKIASVLPDLVLLDLMMPDMNGIEVTHKIRQSYTAFSLPILLVTAHEEVNQIPGLNVKATDLVRKPIDFDDLLTRIEAALETKN